METVQIPDTQSLQQEVQPVLQQVKDLKISSNEEYVQAGEDLKNIKRLQAAVVDTFREPKKLSDEAHKAVCAAEKRHLDPLRAAEAAYKNEMGRFVQERERLRLKEEETRRIQAQKEREAEQKRQEEARLQEAVELEKLGYSDHAEAVINAPIVIPEAAPQPSAYAPPPKAAGIAAKKVYEHEIVNADLLPREFLMADEAKIRKYGNALGKEAKIPGVIFHERIGISGRIK